MKKTLKEFGAATLVAALSSAALAAGESRAAAGALSADWWQWAVSIPTPVNPILDTSGQYCMVGQDGQTWFLAGTSGAEATRACSIPEGVSIFFPLVNAVNFDSPGVCGQVGHLTVAELRGYSAGFIDSITSYSATLDGQPVASIRRIQSPVFPLALPADNFFNAGNCVVPATIYPRSVDDGYYAQIDALRPGVHTLQFAASNATGFNLSVTYELTIVRRSGSSH